MVLVAGEVRVVVLELGQPLPFAHLLDPDPGCRPGQCPRLLIDPGGQYGQGVRTPVLGVAPACAVALTERYRDRVGRTAGCGYAIAVMPEPARPPLPWADTTRRRSPSRMFHHLGHPVVYLQPCVPGRRGERVRGGLKPRQVRTLSLAERGRREREKVERISAGTGELGRRRLRGQHLGLRRAPQRYGPVVGVPPAAPLQDSHPEGPKVRGLHRAAPPARTAGGRRPRRPP